MTDLISADPFHDGRLQPWSLPGNGTARLADMPGRHGAFRGPVLPFGAGRSYGDSCTLARGALVDARRGARIHWFDPDTGLLTADAGVSLGALLAVAAPHHTLPVTPGTQFATLGGAIANDVHGKNHHRRGSFGAHVTGLVLERSDCEAPLTLHPHDPLFAATVGGMGMTGRIVRATVRMAPVASTMIRQHAVRFANLGDYFARAEAADAAHEFAVAWVDQLARGARFGRGHLIVGDHVPAPDAPASVRRLAVPFTPPVPLLNGLTLRAFNALYHARVPAAGDTRTVPQTTFFYPLDAIAGWNRLYGPRGLHQHQSVLPFDTAREAVAELLAAAQRAGEASFLSVLKRFGANRSPALMSFARPGYTLTLDFADHGRRTRDLLDTLDAITLQAGGAVNPYKDRRMAPDTFARSMPGWDLVEAVRDPAILSDFWARTALRLPQRAPVEPPDYRRQIAANQNEVAA